MSLSLSGSLDLLLDDMSSGRNLSDLEVDGMIIAQTSLRGVVEVGNVEGIMRELLSVELDQV